MSLISCLVCEALFNPTSASKRKVGGLYGHCPDCSAETTVRHLGLTAGDGKSQSVTILQFESQSDRERYAAFWQNNSGMHKGKSCQLGSHLSTTPASRFKILQAPGAMNHKGKL
jgi:hypothetical protein